MAETLVAALLTKAKVLGGPLVGVLLLGMSAGWYARGERSTSENLATTVARLDSNTVKRPEFERAVIRLEAIVSRQDAAAVRQDSTNALLRRWICRAQPAVCP